MKRAEIKTLQHIANNPGVYANAIKRSIKSSPNDIYPALRHLVDLRLANYEHGRGKGGPETKAYSLTPLGVLATIHYYKSVLGLKVRRDKVEAIFRKNAPLFPKIISALGATAEQVGFRNYVWRALSDAIDSLVVDWSSSLDSTGWKTHARHRYNTLVESDFIHEVVQRAVESLIFAAGETDSLRDLHVLEMSRALLAIFKEEFEESITEYQNELNESNRQLARIRAELGFE